MTLKGALHIDFEAVAAARPRNSRTIPTLLTKNEPQRRKILARCIWSDNAAAADARAEHDLRVNVKAEAEIEVILTHLEYQNALLIQLMGKIGEEVSEVFGSQPRTASRRRPRSTAKKTIGRVS